MLRVVGSVFGVMAHFRVRVVVVVVFVHRAEPSIPGSQTCREPDASNKPVGPNGSLAQVVSELLELLLADLTTRIASPGNLERIGAPRR